MKRSVLLAAIALAVVVAGTAVAAFPQDGVKLYTGCLTSGGTLVSVKEGDNPTQSCSAPSQVVKLSGGDITSVNTPPGSGLSGGGTNGAVTLTLDAAHSLPSGCTSGQVVKSSGSDSWTCAADNDHTYAADGTTLTLSGDEFSVASGYRVKNNQSCDSGKFASGIDSSGAIRCETPPSGAGTTHVAVERNPADGSESIGILSNDQNFEMVHLDLPAGAYAIFGSGRIRYQGSDSNEAAFADCDLSAGSALLQHQSAIGGGSMPVSFTSAASLAGAAKVTIVCHTPANGQYGMNFRLVAIPVPSASS